MSLSTTRRAPDCKRTWLMTLRELRCAHTCCIVRPCDCLGLTLICIQALIVRAEDSRLMGDMDYMRRAYTELYGLNNQLIGGYNTRASNHVSLLAALKEVNLVIQRASNLRVGSAKSRVVNSCRAAVKANNMEALVNIISGN